MGISIRDGGMGRIGWVQYKQLGLSLPTMWCSASKGVQWQWTHKERVESCWFGVGEERQGNTKKL